MSDDLPPLPFRLAFGLLFGAVGAVVFLAGETAIVGHITQNVHMGSLAYQVITLYAVTGALFGALAGALGRISAAWGFCVAASWTGWLLSGKLGEWMSSIGWPAGEGALIMVPLGVGLGWTLTMDEEAEPRHVGGAVVVFMCTLFGLTLNQHALGSPTSTLALAVDAGIVVVALVTGVGIGALFGRRRVLLPLILIAGGLGTLGAMEVVNPPPPTWPVATEAGTPVVVVVVDTLRADHLGLYGYGRPTSPNLDRWSSGAVVYEGAATAAPWTLPAMGSILSGRLPSQHGAGVNRGHNLQTPIGQDVPTLATLLRDQGYKTTAMVTNPWVLPAFGMHRGFDLYDSRVGELPVPLGLHPWLVLGIEPIEWPAYRDATMMTDAALDFVSAQKGGRWFLLVHYMDPHGPLRPPAEDVEALGPASEEPLVDAYDASIHYLDRELGRLLQALPRDALVVITSDHGEQLLEERRDANRAPKVTRHGHHLHEELLHVPLIVRPPGGGSAQRVRRLVNTVDILPTVAHFTGVTAPDELAGRALSEAWGVGGAARVQIAEAVRYGAELRSVRRGSHKLVLGPRDDVVAYDLAADPLEATPLTLQQLERVRDELLPLLPPVSEDALAPAPSLDAQVQDLLERLGYVDAGAEPVEE